MGATRRIPDAEKTATMLDLLRRRYDAPRYALIENVAPSTGWAGTFSDAIALSLWPSDGFRVTGFELKASKTDLKRELADPTKNEEVRRLCATWWLVVYDEKLIEGLEIPGAWGILVTVEDEHGARKLKTWREPTVRSDDRKGMLPIGFVAAIVRRAMEQSPPAAYFARALVTARDQGARSGELTGKLSVSAIKRDVEGALRRYGYSPVYNEDPFDALKRAHEFALARIATADLAADGSRSG